MHTTTRGGVLIQILRKKNLFESTKAIWCLLDDIARHIPGEKAWWKLDIIDIFAQSLEDRKIRTFQGSLLKECDDICEQGALLRAGARSDCMVSL